MAKKIKTTFQILGWAVFSIWVLGAGITFVLTEYQRKVDCVRSEGLFKGMLWCKTDAITDTELTWTLLKTLGWPLRFVLPPNNKTMTEQYARIFKDCGYAPEFETKASKECVLAKTTAMTGKKTFKEAFCQRDSNTYEQFAKGRDSGVPLDAALGALDELMPDLAQKLSEASGIPIDEKVIFAEVKSIMEFVYAHPEKSPSILSSENYSQCMLAK